jgi:hypothetical protein
VTSWGLVLPSSTLLRNVSADGDIKFLGKVDEFLIQGVTPYKIESS